MNNDNSVKKTRNLDLCVSCELCLAICPSNSISMEYKQGQFLPQVDDTCSQCGNCLQVCPGIEVDPFQLRSKNNITKESFDGNHIHAYTAYSNDLDIRKNSTSGGIVTDLIQTLIENREYDSAFVLPFSGSNYEAFRLKEIKELKKIFKSAKSKYIPVSAYNVIKAIEKRDDSTYIIVATPCVTQGILNYMKIRNLSRANLLFIGLFCDRTLNFNIIKYYEDSYKNKDEKISKLEFRTKEKGGWPGNTKIYFDSHRELRVDKKVRMELKDYFQLNRCLFCLSGKLNPLADISVGDCYLPEEKDHMGKSNVIIRTKKGETIFNRYSNLFTIKEVNKSRIINVQGLKNKIKTLNYVKLFSQQNDLYGDIKGEEYSKKDFKEMLKQQKHVKWGQNYRIRKIKFSIKFHQLTRNLILLSKLTLTGSIIGFQLFKDAFQLLSSRKNVLKRNNDNIVILGGGLHNKGAQAMTFTAVDELKKRFPAKNIYLLSELDFQRDPEEKDKYKFNILPWNPELKFMLLGLPRRFKLNILNWSNEDRYVDEIENLMKNTDFIVDISGYKLSDNSFTNSMDYLLNIMMAQKYMIPYFILPQSMGPFNYPLKYKFILILIKIYLQYPEKIFVREREGLQALKKLNLKNVFKSKDIVLNRSEDYDLHHIFKVKLPLRDLSLQENSIAIIPNLRLLEKTNKKNLYVIYKTLIDTALKTGKTVYILRHSYEDLELCENIKNLFSDNKKVILIKEDLNSIELESIIKKMDIIVASRYHAIIHAYRNNIPTLVIGWATKYYDLLDTFNQSDYFFDIRIPIDDRKLNNSFRILLKNYKEEKLVIKEINDKILKMSVFDKIFA